MQNTFAIDNINVIKSNAIIRKIKFNTTRV